MSYDQKAFDAVLKDFTDFLGRFERNEIRRYIRQSHCGDILKYSVIDCCRDEDILQEVEVRRLEDEIISWDQGRGKTLGEADVNDLLDELASRGEYISTVDTQKAESIYRLFLCGKTEQANEEAFQFIRKTVGGTL